MDVFLGHVRPLVHCYFQGNVTYGMPGKRSSFGGDPRPHGRSIFRGGVARSIGYAYRRGMSTTLVSFPALGDVDVDDDVTIVAAPANVGLPAGTTLQVRYVTINGNRIAVTVGLASMPACDDSPVEFNDDLYAAAIARG